MRNPRGKRAASVPAVAQLGFQFAKLAPFGVVFAGGGAYEQRGAWRELKALMAKVLSLRRALDILNVGHLGLRQRSRTTLY